MAKRRSRRSSKDLTARAMKDIRNLHREHLRQISAILTNVLGFPVRVSPVKTGEVQERKPKRGKVARRTAHVAGFQEEPKPEHLAPDKAPNPPDDGVGF